MSFPLYCYKATAIRVVDGDTAELCIDKGFGHFWNTKVRLSGVNAPEMSTGAPGQASKDWLTQRIMGKQLFIKSESLDKYGRALVTIYEPEPATVDPALSVNQEMLNGGLAVPDGKVKAVKP